MEIDNGEVKFKKLEPLKVTIINHDMVHEHNFPCPICREELAVFSIEGGEDIFKPCWNCQKKDWFTVSVKSSFLRWLLGIRKPRD